MKAFSRVCAIVAPILLLGSLAGCGQTGALYLPTVPPKPVPPPVLLQDATPASGQTAPAAQPPAAPNMAPNAASAPSQ